MESLTAGFPQSWKHLCSKRLEVTDMAQADSDGSREDTLSEETVTFTYPAWMDDLVEGELEYGDSKSEWVREAVRERLEREGLLTE